MTVTDDDKTILEQMYELAAGSCDVEGGKVGDEHGHFYCTLQKKVEAQAAEISKWHTVSRAYLDRIETLRAEIERLNKSAECLAESRRLAVKDLAALEGHMRLEIGQWRVDYDCAIRDIEHLRERIEAQAAEIEQWRECALYDATMEGPVFKGWDRSALERCRRAALDALGFEIREKGQ
jgi:benzoyl-CoA reductase/2-hydroxyglutaryl-CoA dehydratase subunit BcrC/BadD/HgdB